MIVDLILMIVDLEFCLGILYRLNYRQYIENTCLSNYVPLNPTFIKQNQRLRGYILLFSCLCSVTWRVGAR